MIKRAIFIGGCVRSGTTLLGAMLGAPADGAGVTVRHSWFLGCRTGVAGRVPAEGKATDAVTIEHCDFSQAPTFADVEEIVARAKPWAALGLPPNGFELKCDDGNLTAPGADGARGPGTRFTGPAGQALDDAAKLLLTNPTRRLFGLRAKSPAVGKGVAAENLPGLSQDVGAQARGTEGGHALAGPVLSEPARATPQ